MRRQKTFILTFLSLCLLAGGMIWVNTGSFVLGKGKAALETRSKPIAQRLGIEIGLSKPFMVPAASKGHTLETFLRVPTGSQTIDSLVRHTHSDEAVPSSAHHRLAGRRKANRALAAPQRDL